MLTLLTRYRPRPIFRCTGKSLLIAKVVSNLLTLHQLFAEIAPGFASYPKGSFEHKIGVATSLDPESKVVRVTTSSGEETQDYDILVLATGSRTASEAVPWKQSPKGSDFTKEALHKVQAQVKAAKTIILGGGGATAVETAGELAFEFKKTKDITIITSGSQLMDGSMTKKIADGAESQLTSMGVKVVKAKKITSTSILPSGQTEITLNNGEQLTCNLYLPTIGVVPNSEYIPKTLLNNKGEVMVDDFLKVKNVKDVWAAGDITDLEPSTYINTDKQATHVAKSLGLLLAGGAPLVYKYGGPPAMGITLGRSKGTGRAGDYKVPSIMIWWFSKCTPTPAPPSGILTL